MMRLRLVSSLFGTLVVIGILSCVAGECDTNCEWTAWFEWDCSHCCGRSPGPQFAFRQRGICCHNTTDPNQCIVQCGVNPRLAQMPGPCGNICPCPTTKAMATSTAETTGLTTLTRTRVRVSTVSGNEHGSTPNSKTTTGKIDNTSAANGQSVVSTTRKPTTSVPVGLPSVSTTRKPTTSVPVGLPSVSTTRKPTTSVPVGLPSVSTTRKPTTSIPVGLSSASTTGKPVTSVPVGLPSSGSTGQRPGSVLSPILPGGTSQLAVPSIVTVGATSSEQGLRSSTPSGSGLYMQTPNSPAAPSIPLGLELSILAATKALNDSFFSKIPAPGSIGTILTSGFSTLNQVISSAMAHTGSNETMDCRKECSGKVAWDDCLLECFLRPCTTMLTFVSPCLFVLGVIVGSCITCIVRSLLNKKKMVKNAVSPFE